MVTIMYSQCFFAFLLMVLTMKMPKMLDANSEKYFKFINGG